MARGTRGRRLPVTLRDDEVEALLARIPTKSATGLRNRTLVQVFLGAGLRLAEALALLPSDVDLDRGLVRVNRGKGAKDRVVPVDAETLGWLRSWLERRAALGFNGRQPVFCGVRNAGRPLRACQVQRMLASTAKAAGIERQVSPHVLRHTYASRMLRRGYTLAEVRDLLGHANIATTSIYVHADPEDLRRRIQGEERTQAQEVAEALLALLPENVRQALAAAIRAG